MIPELIFDCVLFFIIATSKSLFILITIRTGRLESCDSFLFFLLQKLCPLPEIKHEEYLEYIQSGGYPFVKLLAEASQIFNVLSVPSLSLSTGLQIWIYSF